MRRWILWLALSSAGWAQDPVALVNATVGTSTNSTIVLRNGKVESVGGAIPPGIPRINLAGLHVYPGLVESDSTLGLVEIESVRGGTDVREVGENNADLQAEIAFNPDSELLPVARSAGILTAALQPTGGRISGQIGVLSLWGWTREDMRLAPSPGLVVQWPSWQATKDADKARDDWTRYLEQLQDWFAEARAWRSLPEAQRPIRPDLAAIASVLDKRGKLFVRAQRRHQIESAAEFCAQQDVAWVLVGGAEAMACVNRLVTDRTDVIYTETYRLPNRDYEEHDTFFRVPAQLDAAGVRVALAGPSSHDNARWLPEMAAAAWRHGWTEKAAIAAITSVPCEILGLPDQGHVAPGQRATLIATDRPLLDLRSRVLHAWVRGEKIDLSDRQKNLYERYRRRALTRPGSAGDNQPMIPERLPPASVPQRPRPAGDIKPETAPPRESYEPGVPAQGWSLTGDVRYHEVHSKTLGNTRQVWVYLPPGYAQDAEKNYPVVYAMDGQNLFERGTAFGCKEWGMDEAAQRAMTQGSMQEAIIVAVSSNGQADRMKEYSPVPDPKHKGGGAPDFAKFLKTELKPMIDGAYRTEATRENTAVLGSSMGGLVSLYLGLAHADTFGLIGALSPSLWWAQQHMLEEWKTNPPVQRPEKIWMDMGDREDDDDGNANGVPDVLDHTRALKDVLASQGQSGLMYHEIPGADHSEAAWAGRIQHVLEKLLPPRSEG